MKSKPIVMEHFSTVHTSFVLEFEFTNNIIQLKFKTIYYVGVICVNYALINRDYNY